VLLHAFPLGSSLPSEGPLNSGTLRGRNRMIGASGSPHPFEPMTDEPVCSDMG